MAARSGIAIDIGAESGHVLAVQFDGLQPDIEELYRFPHKPVHSSGTLHCDFLCLLGDIETGTVKGKSLQEYQEKFNDN